jgi:hypothetical protein
LFETDWISGPYTLARRAQQFGQEDDITVISITRQAVGVQSLPPVQAASTAV